MNSTTTPPKIIFNITDYYIVCSLSGISSLTVVIISSLVLILVWQTKPLLHTVKHLLMCNTCIASILYCIIQTVNYIFLILLQSDKSDISCRWRSYFSYLSICAVTYSYLLQAISRSFIPLLSYKYRWSTTFKTHYILILIQWILVIILPLPSIITEDIYYRPNILCWVPLIHLIHAIYTFFAYYIIPTLLACIIYVFIFYQVKKSTSRTRIFVRTNNNRKRDLEVLRNIIILLGIYLLGGLPSVLFLITSNKLIFLISIVCISLAVAVEKLFMCILDRDIRQVIHRLICLKMRILPLNIFITEEKLRHINHVQ